MTHLHNLQRDQTHGDQKVVAITALGTATSISRIIGMQAEATVYQNAGQAQLQQIASGQLATQWSAGGLFITPPLNEPTPYRIKAYCSVNNCAVVIGTQPSPILGSNQLNAVLAFPMQAGKFDDVILYTTEAPGDPVGIGIAFYDDFTDNAQGYISVQNMAIAAPQYSSSSS